MAVETRKGTAHPKVEAKATEVSVADGKSRFSELVRRAELNRESIGITRRGKLVARIIPIEEEELGEEEHWVTACAGLLADAPEVLEAIEEIYRDRRNHMPREFKFAEDDAVE